MRSVLVTTDLVYKSDGTLTPTEINTDSSHQLGYKVMGFDSASFLPNFGDFFRHVEFKQFLDSNNFTKIICIDKKSGCHRIFESFCAYYGVTYEYVEVPPNSITIPTVEDAEDTFIIRVAYDTFALLDDMYARDMYEFLNLIKDETFASKVTFTSEGLDTITSFEASQDGIIPNYVVKPRTPGYPKYEYPKIYRFETTDELASLKQQITDNEFIQKYEFDPSKLVQNRTTNIRSFDLFYGPNLDVFNVMSYKVLNPVSTQNSLLRYDSDINPSTKKVDDLFASKWWPTEYSKGGLMYHFDKNDQLVLSNGNLISGEEVSVGDIMRVVSFSEKLNKGMHAPLSDLENPVIKTGRVSAKTEKGRGIFVNITAEFEGKIYKWFDGSNNLYLVKEQGSETVSFSGIGASQIRIGDIIYAFDQDLNSVVPLTITDLYFDSKDTDLYSITIEGNDDQFLVKMDSEFIEGEQQKTLYLIQNNACSQWCGVFYNCYDNPVCDDCGKGSSNCPNCGGFGSFFCNSDSRLKNNINKIGISESGLNVYTFSYLSEPNVTYQGVIAQDLIGTEFERAICINDDGMYMVNYSLLDVEFKKIIK